MALQLFKIASTTVESPQASIDFQNIPSGYTDLIVYLSTRTNNVQVYDILKIQFNNSGGTSYSYRRLLGSGSSVSSASQSSVDGDYEYMATGTNATSNTFGNTLIYIPNYTSSNNKSFSIDGSTENNATESYLAMNAGLWTNSAAINRITFYANNSFLTNSTATLYGVL